jgi:hypothetical protein
MAIPSRQIGWGTTDNLLWEISKQIEAVTGIAANSTGSGTSGTSGVTGLSGTSGTSGVVGTSGTTGTSGTSGITGSSGTTGTSGNSGTSGTSATLNSTGGNVDTLSGVAMRTLYSRTNVISYSIGTDADLLGGSSNFGSRNLPLQFFTDSTNYNAKGIHFRITGLWGSDDATPTVDITIKIGNDVLNTSTITGAQANGHPAEIMGEIMFTNGQAICCYSIAWCENNGTLRRYALSNPSSPITVSSFTGGDFQVIMENTTTNSFTSYLGYLQIWN